MVKKKYTAVNAKNLQNMFESIDIQIPVPNPDDKQKSGYKNRRYTENFSSHPDGKFESNEDTSSTWRKEYTSNRKDEDDNFTRFRNSSNREETSDLNDENWANIRSSTRDLSDEPHWRDQASRNSNSKTSAKESTDTRPTRLKLKLLPKGAKEKLILEGKLDADAIPTVSKALEAATIAEKEAKKEVKGITKKSEETPKNPESKEQEDPADLDPAVKSRMDAIKKQKELEEAANKEILLYNSLFDCDSEQAVEILNYTNKVFEEGAKDFDTFIKSSGGSFETLVPSLVASCFVISKMSEVTSLEESTALMSKVKDWLNYLIEISGVTNHEFHLLTQICIICDHWNLPSLSENLYLVEAVFDSLYCTGIVSQSTFLKWFNDDFPELSSRATIRFQLLAWHNWLLGEEEASEHSEEEDSQEEEDIDIEALVPKRVEIKARKPGYAF